MGILRTIRVVSAYALLAATLGCEKYTPVEGTVTLDGKPLEGATVAFLPKEIAGRGGPQPASYITNAEGTI